MTVPSPAPGNIKVVIGPGPTRPTDPLCMAMCVLPDEILGEVFHLMESDPTNGRLIPPDNTVEQELPTAPTSVPVTTPSRR